MANSVIDKAFKQTMKDQIKKVKLWSNASPNSSFPDQKILIQNILEYNDIDVNYKPTDASITRKSENTPIYEGTNGTMTTLLNLGVSSTTTTAYRPYTIESDGLDFDANKTKAGPTGNANVDNGYNIPLDIYGTKIIAGGGSKLLTKLRSLFSFWERRCAVCL